VGKRGEIIHRRTSPGLYYTRLTGSSVWHSS
jgi:hypothetical protein